MPLLDEDILYILNNKYEDIFFESKLDEDKKIFQNKGLVNYIRIFRFIPDGITLIRKRRSKMAVKKTSAVKKATKKAPAKKATKTKKAMPKSAK